MTKKRAVGASFKTSTKPLIFNFRQDADPVRGGTMTVELTVLASELTRVVVDCELDKSSRLAFIVEIRCPSFRVRRELWSHMFRADDVEWTSKPATFEIPADMILAGCIVEAQVVVSEVSTDGSRLACSIPGGIVARGSREFEPKNGAGLFPVRAKREPALWSFRFSIETEADLEKTVGAAFRLDVDAEHFGELLDPARASEEVRTRTEEMLLVEALTAAVISVLGNEDLVREFDTLLQVKDPPEKSMNSRSARYFLLGLMRRLPDDVISMRFKLLDDPAESAASIRRIMADLIKGIS